MVNSGVDLNRRRTTMKRCKICGVIMEAGVCGRHTRLDGMWRSACKCGILGFLLLPAVLVFGWTAELSRGEDAHWLLLLAYYGCLGGVLIALVRVGILTYVLSKEASKPIRL